MSKNKHRKNRKHDKAKPAIAATPENAAVPAVEEVKIPKHFKTPRINLFYVNSDIGAFKNEGKIVFFDSKAECKSLRDLLNRKSGCSVDAPLWYVSKGPDHYMVKGLGSNAAHLSAIY